MRLRLAAALALILLTGIGGHYLNRRPDRALFFGALLLAGTLFGSLFSAPELGAWVPALPAAIPWLLSVAFTWHDARTAAPPVQPSSWMGKAARLPSYCYVAECCISPLRPWSMI